MYKNSIKLSVLGCVLSLFWMFSCSSDENIAKEDNTTSLPKPEEEIIDLNNSKGEANQYQIAYVRGLVKRIVTNVIAGNGGLTERVGTVLQEIDLEQYATKRDAKSRESLGELWLELPAAGVFKDGLSYTVGPEMDLFMKMPQGNYISANLNMLTKDLPIGTKLLEIQRPILIDYTGYEVDTITKKRISDKKTLSAQLDLTNLLITGGTTVGLTKVSKVNIKPVIKMNLEVPNVFKGAVEIDLTTLFVDYTQATKTAAMQVGLSGNIAFSVHGNIMGYSLPKIRGGIDAIEIKDVLKLNILNGNTTDQKVSGTNPLIDPLGFNKINEGEVKRGFEFVNLIQNFGDNAFVFIEDDVEGTSTLTTSLDIPKDIRYEQLSFDYGFNEVLEVPATLEVFAGAELVATFTMGTNQLTRITYSNGATGNLSSVKQTPYYMWTAKNIVINLTSTVNSVNKKITFKFTSKKCKHDFAIRNIKLKDTK